MVITDNVYKQDWPDMTRFVIATTGGTVQLELYRKPNQKRITAYIFALYVDESMRGKKIGDHLMSIAEKIAKDYGHKAVHLEWSLNESPYWVADWYGRRGYVDVEFGVGKNACALMTKRL